MKFKLDECIDARLSINLRKAGYEAVTTQQQGLHGISKECCHQH
jgi:predicted nuclease of predicted toxin-antitoxin system